MCERIFAPLAFALARARAAFYNRRMSRKLSSLAPAWWDYTTLDTAIIEAAARSANSGGLLAPLLALFGSLPAGTYVTGAARSGVAPAALGAGYFSYFIYTFLLGVSLLPVAIIVARRKARSDGAS